VIVVFVRHAERKAAGSDPGLTSKGQQRAQLLARMLKEAGMTAIFTSTFRRTKETAAPLAALLHVVPKVIAEDLDEGRAQLLESGERVLVVGHTDTVPELVAAMGGPAGLTIGDEEFDRFLALTVTATDAVLLHLRY
jgi:phosphohistidine phosphatase SixA